jgi:hypothetical protein
MQTGGIELDREESRENDTRQIVRIECLRDPRSLRETQHLTNYERVGGHVAFLQVESLWACVKSCGWGLEFSVRAQ